MSNTTIVIMILVSIISFTGIFLVYYIYKLVLIDANSRNISKPKFWAFLASSTQNGSGLPLYLFKRKRTLSFLTVAEKKQVRSIKRKLYALLFLDLLIFLLAVIIF